jgi:poly-gamma-glutamate synthesis protein (capsule biosynthesis protein)
MSNQNLSLVSVGDAFISKRFSVFSEEEEFSSLIKNIRDADVAFVNLETAIHSFEGYPIGEGKGDAYGQADPYIADEFKWAGFGLISRANNHSMDYSLGGMIETSKNLDRVGLTHAGVGMNLGEAREPAYRETKNGIVSLISASTNTLGMASHARKNLMGRPGLNPLRLETVYKLDSKSFKAMKEIIKNLGLWNPRTPNDAEKFTVHRRDQYELAEETKVVRTVNKLDFEGNIKAVKDARRLSDWVVFSLHNHISAVKVPEGFKTREVVAEPIEGFARACIDSGADVFIAHGPHVLRGLEIYKGKPIFYSLGNFVFQSTLIKRQPSDLFERYGLTVAESTADLYEKREAPPAHFFDDIEYWESVAAECLYEDKQLVQLKLHPLSLDYDPTKPLREQRTKAGIPRLADRTLGKKIIDDMKKLSSRYGTSIEFKDGIGIVII